MVQQTTNHSSCDYYLISCLIVCNLIKTIQHNKIYFMLKRFWQTRSQQLQHAVILNKLLYPGTVTAIRLEPTTT